MYQFNVTHTYLIERYINAECRSRRWKQLDTKTGDITREIYIQSHCAYISNNFFPSRFANRAYCMVA